MSTFKVGQRVRIVARVGISDPDGMTGKETTITGPFYLWDGRIPAYPTAISDARSPGHGIRAECLEPILDPKADEFLERIKKLKPYDEPKRIAAKVPQ